MNIHQLAASHQDRIIALRRDFHQHPELSGKELRTAQKVCEELERLGIPYVRLHDQAVVGLLVGGKTKANSKRLAIRADMDALPVQEETGLPFASKNEGCMHACGHDGHTAMLLGAAAMLREMQAELAGSVYFCFQGSEEISAGAAPILTYLKSQGGVDQVIAAHLWADLDSGLMSLEPGARMAARDSFTLTITGRGGHASRPDLCIDPIKPLCQTVLALSAIPTNRVSTLQPCVVHIGQIAGGSIANVFPQTASCQGAFRTFSEASRQQVGELICQIAVSTAAAYGATASVDIVPNSPPLMNDATAVSLGQQVLAQTGLFMPDPFAPILASENFSLYLQQYPGFMCYIGIRNEEKGLVYTQHHPRFDIDEDVLARGSAFFASYASAFFHT